MSPDHSGPYDHSLTASEFLHDTGTPMGEVFDFELVNESPFPGTRRNITVYVPAQYDASFPACVYVGLDGIRFSAAQLGSELEFNVPAILDNLISKNEIPITIAIGVSPGVVPSALIPENPRFNRSFEFDSLNRSLADFLLDEILPAVERQRTPLGKSIRLSTNPDDCMVGGVSTGAAGAFTAAWERPDAFRRVLCGLGTFVGMRGADRYPVLIRKTEPKPLRVFLQDGSNDQWLGGPEMGDWWMANQTMERALRFAGYDVGHVWDDGNHDPGRFAAVFPDAMRWLWRDWPAGISAGSTENSCLKAVLASGSNWEIVEEDIDHEGVLESGSEGVVTCVPKSSNATRVNLEEVQAKFTLQAHDGSIYLTDLGDGSAAGGRVWRIAPSGEASILDSGLNNPTGIALSPDGAWLIVAEGTTHWAYSYRVSPDGSLDARQKFYWFHVPDHAEDSGAGQLAVDREGRLYAATRMGVQILDRNGRVRAIVPAPGGAVNGLAFGGPDQDIIFVICADRKLYKRKLAIRGWRSWESPIELPPWGWG